MLRHVFNTRAHRPTLNGGLGESRSWCCIALVLSLPLLTGRLPGESHLQGLLGSPMPVAPRAANNGEAGGAGAIAVAGTVESDRYRITPERRALLNTIRYAEGTWLGGRDDGYRVIYGGRRISDLARHPETTVQAGYSSAAAGAYQFLPGTWREAARTLGLPDFGPGSQDQAALYLIEKRGVLSQIDRHGLGPQTLAQLAPEWASLPSSSGQSYYGQPVHDARELLRFYSQELSRQRGLQAARTLQA